MRIVRTSVTVCPRSVSDSSVSVQSSSLLVASVIRAFGSPGAVVPFVPVRPSRTPAATPVSSVGAEPRPSDRFPLCGAQLPPQRAPRTGGTLADLWQMGPAVLRTPQQGPASTCRAHLISRAPALNFPLVSGFTVLLCRDTSQSKGLRKSEEDFAKRVETPLMRCWRSRPVLVTTSAQEASAATPGSFGAPLHRVFDPEDRKAHV